eukprot:CAMPEP_0195121264 /NCGR_PEP_ID=MMETSP0448-20130528/123855_1 /TAXON_ID=66468 /ORGANISM="Heterocapsa triquestra, Strain CCMP 448" /LENGTH=58 /DNA_ID=CAMNT_0040158731 /DNA_START=191 /DNA_END=364 /DNA_ORIENTATION=-
MMPITIHREIAAVHLLLDEPLITFAVRQPRCDDFGRCVCSSALVHLLVTEEAHRGWPA